MKKKEEGYGGAVFGGKWRWGERGQKEEEGVV